jgi:O-antigen/teichoic acid export membrane protein
VLFPAFSRIAVDTDRLREAFLRSLRWICASSFPAGLIFLPLGVPIAVTVFGSEWRPAGEAMMALSLVPAGAMLSVTASEVMKAIGRPQLLARVQIVITVVTVVAILALQPAGLTAAAAGVSIGAVAGGAWALWLLRREIRVSLRSMFAEIWPPALAALLAAGALLPVEALVDAESHRTVVALALILGETLLGGLAYLAILHLFARTTTHELIAGIRRLIASRRRAGDEQVEPEILDETLAP